MDITTFKSILNIFRNFHVSSSIYEVNHPYLGSWNGRVETFQINTEKLEIGKFTPRILGYQNTFICFIYKKILGF